LPRVSVLSIFIVIFRVQAICCSFQGGNLVIFGLSGLFNTGFPIAFKILLTLFRYLVFLYHIEAFLLLASVIILDCFEEETFGWLLFVLR
jgi:hypothetical protein